MNSFRCPNCGLPSFANVKSCKRCKTEFGQNTADSSASAVDAGISKAGNQNNFASSAPFGETSPTYGQNQNSWQTDNRQNFPPPNNSQFGYAPQFSYQNQPPKLKSGLAIASMVMGCAGFAICWGFFGLLSLAGLITGVVALVKANKKPFEYGGKGFAVAGIVTNGFLLLLMPITLAIAIPNLLAARQAANEGAATASMRTLLKAETVFMSANASGRCGDLNELLGSRLIDSTLANGEKIGYKYVIAKNANGSCELFASPLVANGVSKTGNRSFYASTNEGEIHAANKNGAQAGKNDPLLGQFSDSLEGPRRRASDRDDY